MKSKNLVPIAIILIEAIVLGFAISEWNLYSACPGDEGYITDEVWYVSSARNMLTLLFGLQPKPSGSRVTATIELPVKPNLSDIIKVATQYNITLLKTNYEKINAIYIAAPDMTSLNLFARNLSATRIVLGYKYKDVDFILTYLNTEHPPLVKYFIALSMLLIGDYPMSWRIPSIIAGSLTILLTALLISKLIENYWAGVFAAILLAIDPLFRAMSGVALLDIFVSLFVVASLYMAYNRRFGAAGILLGAAIASKFSAVFSVIPLWITMTRRGAQVSDIIRLGIVVPILIFILISMPMIATLGVNRWMSESVIGAIKWHTQSKHEAGQGPPVSAPWQWITGENSFWLHINPNIVARGNGALYTFVALISILAAVLLIDKEYIFLTMLWLWGTWAGYVVLWIIGNRTQYSFYAIHIAPLIYIALITYVFKILADEFTFREIMRRWYLALTRLYISFIKFMKWLLWGETLGVKESAE